MNMKKNNKGFSLVELIVVIAIMAVLMAVLAPALLTYVEKSKLQADNTALGEIANAVKVAATDSDVCTEVTGGVTITFDATGAVTVPGTLLPAKIAPIVGDGSGAFSNIKLTSNTYKTTQPSIQITVTNGVVQVTGNIINEPGSTTTVTKNF